MVSFNNGNRFGLADDDAGKLLSEELQRIIHGEGSWPIFF